MTDDPHPPHPPQPPHAHRYPRATLVVMLVSVVLTVVLLLPIPGMEENGLFVVLGPPILGVVGAVPALARTDLRWIVRAAWAAASIVWGLIIPVAALNVVLIIWGP